MEDDLAIGALNGQPPQPQAKPQQQQQAAKFGQLGQAMQQWMMDSYAVGATGGDVVRSGLEASYNNYAELMTNVMQKNIPNAREARSKWKEAAEGTLAFNSERLKTYQEIFSEQDLGKLNEIAEGHYGDRLMAGLAQEQNTTAIGRYIDLLTQQQQKAEQATKMLEQQFSSIEAKMPQDSGMMQ